MKITPELRSNLLLVAMAAFVLSTTTARADLPEGYRLLASDKGKVVIVAAGGKVEWETETKVDVHDLWLLTNGNVLYPMTPSKVVEVTPEKKVVWEYEAKPVAGNTKHVEIHAIQPLEKGLVMVAESGNGRIVEVDRAGKVVHSIALQLAKPDPHRDTRLVRRLENGNYLVCHEAEGSVREYDRAGKVVWSYTVDLGGPPRSPGHGPEGHGTEVYGAWRLKNGNTLIAGGNNNRVLEVDKGGKLVWSLDQRELPGITLAWVTQLHALPNGNIIIGNCHAGEENPQLFEVTRDKKVVWQFKDFKTFGNGLAASFLIGVPEGTVR